MTSEEWTRGPKNFKFHSLIVATVLGTIFLMVGSLTQGCLGNQPPGKICPVKDGVQEPTGAGPLKTKSSEDQRVACGMIVTLSSAVMTSALAVLAGQITFAAFLFDKNRFRSYSRVRLGLISALNFTSVFCLVGSIIAGGQGVAVLYKAGFAGDWELASSGNYFEVQTDLCLAGLLLFVAIVVAGVSVRRKPAGRRV